MWQGGASLADTQQTRQAEIPAHLWEECPHCRQLLYKRELEKQLWVCGKCGHHFRLSVWQRLQITADEGSFEEWDADLPLHDPLKFPGYYEKLVAAQEKTGVSEAVLTGAATIAGVPVGLGLMNLAFIGGSMGWVVGERITRLFERCAELGRGVVIFCASGGARMQESLVSLMQMPKTAAASRKLQDAGQLYLSVLTDPTYGGVTASYAMLGDVIIAEPGTAMGFAVPRVVEVTGLAMPPGVQTAEFQYKHGMIDMIVPRAQIKETLA
ncbi:MAG: acetyl-CoA carboxylase carboxyl transferase subunit beta, partial [Armatimonadetes bacterium]|nr:acetyl-CoA carboxylase carboxyl transferase subunit beta [Armatimonadota bacterium]